MRVLKYISMVAIGAVTLSGIPAGAQQQPTDSQQSEQPATPIPAIRSPLASAADNGDADQTGSSPLLTPDTRSLTGVQDLSLGTVPLTHSYWEPRLSLSGTADSNPGLSTSSSSWSMWTSFFGGVDVHRTSSFSDLLLSYTGGYMYTNSAEAQSGVVQELSLKDKFSFRRSTFSIFDQLSYLPESSFGFAGAAGSGLQSSTGLGLGNSFTPGQSILTERSQNLSNAFNAEFDTSLSRRTSLTLVGGYSLLHYFDSGFDDYSNATFQAGYNYQATRNDTVAISYQFSAFRYSNLDQSLNSNTIQGSYARRITGRLAFQIAAGPQFISSHFPVTGSTGSSASTTGSTSSLYWALNTSLQYQVRRAVLAASYNHGVTAGSGLLAGAETDVATGSLNGQLTRTFRAGWNFGYSRNQGFSTTTSTAAQTYSYWFTGVNVTHPFGRSLDVFMNYSLQHQDSTTGGCVGTGCSGNVVRNQIAFGVNVHKQPIPF